MKIIDDGTVTLPKGFYGAGGHVGIKKEKKDLALIYKIGRASCRERV